MGRVLFPRGRQRIWIEKVLKESGLSSTQLSNLYAVNRRTFSDWKTGKFSIREGVFKKLCKRFNSTVPEDVKVVPDYWYATKGARKGALKRLELYGLPGTPEGRKKGGQISQLRRKLYPELYKNCNIAKTWNEPGKSEELAELVGIILGDGGISDYQVKVSLNRELEQDYLQFVVNLIHKLFGEEPKKHNRNTPKKAVDICISGVKLVELLQKLGLEKGDKVIHQVEVPLWIWKRREYSISCLRGLIDTDGCVFLHDHTIHDIRCLNLGMCFSSHSQPLLDFVYSALNSLGYVAKRRPYNVFLYREKDVLKYAGEIGFSNSHHRSRLDQFLEKKYNWVRCWSGRSGGPGKTV